MMNKASRFTKGAARFSTCFTGEAESSARRLPPAIVTAPTRMAHSVKGPWHHRRPQNCSPAPETLGRVDHGARPDHGEQLSA